MTESNDSEDDYFKKLLAKTIDAFTEESGEEPALMINVGDEFCEGVLCHSSVVKSKAPYLYDLFEKNKRRGTLGMTRRVEYPKQGDQTSAHQSESLEGVSYYLYELCCKITNEVGAMELVSLALSFKLYELAMAAMVVMSVTRSDSWTFVTGEGR